MENEQLFIQGFNSGYLLAKYEPQLAEKVFMIEGVTNDYFNGLLSGRSQYLVEKTKSKLKSRSKTIEGNKRRSE